MFATRARRGVESARLGLDATKAKAKGGKGEEDLPVSDERRAEIERKEDEFVGVTEEAVGVMKNVRRPLSVEYTLVQATLILSLFDRYSIHQNLCEILQTSSLRNLNITKRRMRS